MHFSTLIVAALAAVASASPAIKRQAECPEVDNIPICGVSLLIIRVQSGAGQVQNEALLLMLKTNSTPASSPPSPRSVAPPMTTRACAASSISCASLPPAASSPTAAWPVPRPCYLLPRLSALLVLK
jgi:hypothetical protein